MEAWRQTSRPITAPVDVMTGDWQPAYVGPNTRYSPAPIPVTTETAEAIRATVLAMSAG
jgi:hypothetical protein